MSLGEKERRALYAWVYEDGETPVFLYEEFMGEMPYGTATAKTGDPDNWLADHVEWVMERYFDELEEERKLRFERKVAIQLVRN